MTIAACYLSHEGVVLGADSTASFPIVPAPGLFGFHYYNHNQKLFELGSDSTVGVLTWGLGNLETQSYRTLLAILAERVESKRPKTLSDVVGQWRDLFWSEYDACSWVRRCRDLATKLPYVRPGATPPVAGTAPAVVATSPATSPAQTIPNTGPAGGATAASAAAPAPAVVGPAAVQPPPATRTEAEEAEFQVQRQNLVVGFCIGGYWLPDRTPSGFTIVFDPVQGMPTPVQLAGPGQGYAWGAPNLIRRLIRGVDDSVKAAILGSGKWNGTVADLDAMLARFELGHGNLPIRDAVDYVHMCIQSTIKGLKFSSLFQICGGPIELAVITSDRKFRWVRHKSWDSALEES